MEVLPTAALPHKTSFTAFFVVGLVSTLGCFQFYFLLEEKKHIISDIIYYELPHFEKYEAKISILYFKQQKKQEKMVWYFNFCSPHLTDDANVNLNRTIMVVEVVVAMLITFIVHMLAELYDEEASRVKNQVDPPEANGDGKIKQIEDSAIELRKNSGKQNDDVMSVKSTKSKAHFASKVFKGNEPGFFKNRKVFFLSVQTVENKSPCFFGHFAIAIAACAMYSPFIAQTLIGILYLVSVIAMLVFEAWKFERWLLISVAVSYLSILALITSAVVGVGLTNWDPFTLSCYYTKLGM